MTNKVCLSYLPGKLFQQLLHLFLAQFSLLKLLCSHFQMPNVGIYCTLTHSQILEHAHTTQ